MKRIILCDNCQKELTRSPCFIRSSNFCDTKCHGEWLSKNNQGSSNPRYNELQGKVFGRWKVLEYAGGRKWLCECSCDKKTRQCIYAYDLTHGNSKSCSCLQRETAGVTASKRETQFTPEQHECIEGLLLSDAGLWRRTSVHTSSVRLQFGSVAKPLVEYVRKVLPLSWHFQTRKAHSKHIAENTKASLCKPFYMIATPVDRSFLSYDQRWYQRNLGDRGVKRVPADLVLTPTVVLFWFLGDGSTHWTKHRSNSKLATLRFHTNGFTADDVARLIRKLQDLHPDMLFNMHRSSEGAPVIESCRSDTIRVFFKYIGNPPQELAGCTEMESKWKVPTGKKLMHYGERPEDTTLFRRVRFLSEQGYSDKVIARILTKEGFLTARGKAKWSDVVVKVIREHYSSRWDILCSEDTVVEATPDGKV